MTIAPQNPSTRTPARAIDMRCAAAPSDGPAPGRPAPGRPARREHGRCQLLAGHDGVHALMYGDGATRRVLAWVGCETPRPLAEWRGLAWMRGLPFPAWFEPDR